MDLGGSSMLSHTLSAAPAPVSGSVDLRGIEPQKAETRLMALIGSAP